jgi:MFS family permease
LRPARRLSLVAACSGYFFVLLDVTIVNVALARIAAELGGSRAELQWVVDAYALVLASLMLSTGNVADLYGRRRVFSVGLAGFGLASLLCGLAPGIGMLVVARVLQGLAAAAICRRLWRSSATPSRARRNGLERSASGRALAASP